MPASFETDSDAGTRLHVFSSWNLATIMLIVGLVVWTDVERFMDPVGEKYVKILQPGNADFFFPFGGARAIAAGVNPYVNELPGLDDPWHRSFGVVGGKEYRGIYPPTQFLLYLPLALITDDWQVAGRILFFVNVLVLGLLAVHTRWFVVQITEGRGPWQQIISLLVPLFFVILAINSGTSLGLERGNGGDILGAALCWSAVVLFLKGGRFLPMLLVVPAVLLKGYPLWWGVGLGLLGLTRRGWLPTVAGALAGLLIFLLPVARYLPEALRLISSYTGITGNYFWWNHSFWNVFGHIDPALAEPGRWAMASYCTALSVVCWLRARKALQAESLPEAALWLCFFTVCSIEIMLGSVRTSIVYDLILILPGLLVFFLLTGSLLHSCGLSAEVRWPVGVLLVISAFFTFKFALFDSAGFPTPGIGMILILLTMGGIWIAGTTRRRKGQKA